MRQQQEPKPSKVREITTDEAIHLMNMVNDTIYNYGKAKICNILEATIESDTKLSASKRLVEDVLDKILHEVSSTIEYTLLEN